MRSDNIRSIDIRQQHSQSSQYNSFMRSRRPLHQHEQPETLGQRLSRLRKAKGITQVELADRLKISQSNVSEYERDNLRMHADIVVELTKILDVSADELLGIRASARQPPIKDRRFLHELAAIDRLPKRDKDALLRTVRLYTAKAHTEPMRRSQAAAK